MKRRCEKINVVLYFLVATWSVAVARKYCLLCFKNKFLITVTLMHKITSVNCKIGNVYLSVCG